jgi:ribosome-associated protein
MADMGRYPKPEEVVDNVVATDEEGPSKAMRKRAATAAQKLGERLVGLGEADLAKLPLPEPLLDAIRAARSMNKHGALARQRQYIGRLMRDIDLEPVLKLLTNGARERALEAERFRRIEAWRDRLIAEGDSALTVLGDCCTLTPEQRTKLVKLLHRARRNASSEAQRAAAARELFRALRGLGSLERSELS